MGGCKNTKKGKIHGIILQRETRKSQQESQDKLLNYCNHQLYWNDYNDSN